MAVSDRFKELVVLYKAKKIAAPKLKAITIAQWIHESGRGTSELFTKYNNAAGMKYRVELNHLATPVDYVAHDGLDTYCSFKSLEDFLSGYWTFISRPVYQGWEKYANDPGGYLKHLIACNYAEDGEYLRKVLGHLDEAEKLLESASEIAYSSANWLSRYLDHNGMPVIVAFNGSKPLVKFTSKVKEEQHSFENLFMNAGTVTMGPVGGKIPEVPEWFDSASVEAPESSEPTKPKVDILLNSPNQSKRGATITHIVMHATAGSFTGAIDWLCKPASKASAHLVISQTGSTAELVPLSEKAWHAGNARYNANSIGIELEAYNSKPKLTETQSDLAKNWVRWLMHKYDIPKENVIIHRWVRNTDCPMCWTDEEFKAWRDSL